MAISTHTHGQSQPPVVTDNIGMPAHPASVCSDALSTRRYRQYVRPIDRLSSIWCHGLKEISMKPLDRLTQFWTPRIGIIVVAAVMVLSLSSLSEHLVGLPML